MNKNEDKLLDYILTICEIKCSKCGTTKVEYDADEYHFAKHRDEDGWKATNMNVYCPECAIKIKRLSTKK